MRIGMKIIDIENLSVEDLTAVIVTARAIRERKRKAEALVNRLHSVVEDAREAGFDFVDKSCGFIFNPNDFALYANQ